MLASAATLAALAAPAPGAVQARAAGAGQDVRYVDYAWTPPPKNIIEMRRNREKLRVPSLLAWACGRQSPPGFTEDFGTQQLAKVELLRMLETPRGTEALHAALRPGEDKPLISSPPDPRGCMQELDPKWNLPFGQHSGAAAPGWRALKKAFDDLPYFSGMPGSPFGMCNRPDPGDADLGMAVLMRVYLRARDRFPADYDATVSRKLWLQGGFKDIDHSYCGIAGVDVPETENHEMLIDSTRFLHNDHLPPITQGEVRASGNKWVAEYDDDNFDYNNRSNGLDAHLGSHLDLVLSNQQTFFPAKFSDFNEYNARPYSRYQMVSLLNLYDFARDRTLKSRVRAALDFLMAKNTAESLTELRVSPFRRRIDTPGRHNLFDYDPLSAMAQAWVGDLAPYRTTSPNFAGEAVFAGSSDYRVPDALADVMLDPAHHAWRQGFMGRGQDERAFARPGYTITGGGIQTDCPYYNKAPVKFGGHCPGSGNDSGTSEPIVVVPRLGSILGPGADGPRELLQYDVIHSTTPHNAVIQANSCIGAGYACAPAFAPGGPWVKPECTVDKVDSRTKDRVRAYRFDKDCSLLLGEMPDACFFTYMREVKEMPKPLSYVVTHDCDAGGPDAAHADQFRRFVNFQDRPDNAPSSVSVQARGPGAVEASVTIGTPPSVDGPIADPARRVRLALVWPPKEEKYQYYSDGDTGWPQYAPGTLAAGDLVNVDHGDINGDRLRIDDQGADQRLLDYYPAGGETQSLPGIRSLRTRSRVIPGNGSPDTVEVTDRSIRQPRQLREARITVTDLSGKVLGRGYRGFEFGEQQADTLTVPVNLTQVAFPHTYFVRSCLTWYRFYTADDYAEDPYGERPDGVTRCVRSTVSSPQAQRGGPSGPK